jgi:hypothetical protein
MDHVMHTMRGVHSAHSSDLRSCAFLIFGQLKKALKFTSDDDMQDAIIVVYAAAQELQMEYADLCMNGTPP